jgi:AcrR family transcriptional regulator
MLYHAYAILSSLNGPRDRTRLRQALIETAARLIATEGVGALTLRRVAEEVGTSTMAIYTHFGGMDELRRAVRREGYLRLATQIGLVQETADPVADLATIGRVYYENAIRNPHLYRVMFMEQPLDEVDAATGSETYESLARAMRRCLDAGRFDHGDPQELAREFWALGHGMITLQLAQLVSPDEARRCLGGLVLKLFRANGDDDERAMTSFVEGLRATPMEPAT